MTILTTVAVVHRGRALKVRAALALPLLRHLVDNARRRARIRRDYQELLSGPDYLLDDIGVTRSALTTALTRRPL